MKVLCVGMMVYDVPMYPIPQNIMQIDRCEIKPVRPSAGGDATNVSIALAKLGINSALIGKIGRDSQGEYIKKFASDAGVDVTGVLYDNNLSTAVAYVFIGEDKERHFATNCEIFVSLSADDISEESVKLADIVFFGSAMVMRDMDAGGTKKLFQLAHKHGAVTVMDTAMEPGVTGDYLLKISDVLHETDMFFPSFEEALILTGKEDPREMRNVFAQFNLKVLVIKMGAKGCYITDFKEERMVSGFSGIKAEDTTGAGDSFVAGFLCAYSKGWDIWKCAKFANAVAALNVTAVGATAGVPDFETALRFMEASQSER